MERWNGHTPSQPRSTERPPWKRERRAHIDAVNAALRGREFLWNGAVTDVRVDTHHLPSMRVLLTPRGDRLSFHSFPLFANMTVILTTDKGEREVRATDDAGTCHFSCYPHAQYTLHLEDRSRQDVPFGDLCAELPASCLADAARHTLQLNRAHGERAPLHALRTPAAIAEDLRRRHADILSAGREEHLYGIQDRLSGY